MAVTLFLVNLWLLSVDFWEIIYTGRWTSKGKSIQAN